MDYKLGLLKAFWHDQQDHDLVEFALVLAFVTLTSGAIYMGAGGHVTTISSTSNSHVVRANVMESGT